MAAVWSFMAGHRQLEGVCLGHGSSKRGAFNGQVKGVQLAVAEAAEEADHLVDAETAIRVAMARQ